MEVTSPELSTIKLDLPVYQLDVPVYQFPGNNKKKKEGGLEGLTDMV